MCDKTNTSFEEYFNRVESYFALKRDKAVLLSPEEFEVVELLYNEGVPVKVIFRGIDRFFEKKKKRKRRSGRMYFLTQIKEDIELVWEDYKRKGAGSYLISGETEEEFIKQRIDELMYLLENVHPELKSVCHKVKEKLNSLKLKIGELTLEGAEKEMEKILQFAENEIFGILSNELVDIKEEVEREVEDLVKSLGKNISSDVLNRFKKQIIFEKLNFPEISLFN